MKMASQRFCLRWNNHQSNLLSVFDQLLHAETFTDVTLAVDGQYLKAHKMVLSACSPYFNALFINHPEKHPIVILKDVPYADMKSLLDFMYRGEVSVDQERLTAFLRVAESLRIKGLTEVNDDKPSSTEPTPQPPQLQRIQPYVVQQQQQQQRHKSHQNSSGSNSQLSAAQQQQQQQTQQQQQQQQSLLSSALASMPKRKRGRPRKLSGSDDGDYDEFEGELNDSKMCNDMFSGNEDNSDDNQRDSGNNDDLNESRDSLPPIKKSRNTKERNQQPQDDSTSVHLVSSSPELSQRLFGPGKTATKAAVTTIATPSNIAMPQPKTTAMITLVPQNSIVATPPKITIQSNTSTIELTEVLNANLPTVLGLRVKSNLQSAEAKSSGKEQSTVATSHVAEQAAPQTITLTSSSATGNPNSLLKQQLRSSHKDIIDVTLASSGNSGCSSGQQQQSNASVITPDSHHMDTQEACSALQSLATAAERQAQNNIQPPSANNLRHQFMLHMAANPILKSSGDFFQPHSNAMLMREEDNNIDLLMDQSDKSDPEMLTLADENAGLDYSTGNETCGNHSGTNENGDTNNATSSNSRATTSRRNSTGKPIQRRRVRRKAQSSLDDQAEQLTEMSVRGLDLFRYASITEGVYQCTECAKDNMQKTFKNKYSFQRHAFLYHEGKHRKVFPCPLCGKEFSRPDKMKNHMKMTHESFVAKEIHNFNPLNYLITAATAGEMQTSPSAGADGSSQPLLNQLQSNNPALSIMINNGNEPGEEQQAEDCKENMEQQLKFPTDIEIKNEIIISPSPSPPPALAAQTCQLPAGTTVSLADHLTLYKNKAQNAAANAQRLEEVK